MFRILSNYLFDHFRSKKVAPILPTLIPSSSSDYLVSAVFSNLMKAKGESSIRDSRFFVSLSSLIWVSRRFVVFFLFERRFTKNATVIKITLLMMTMVGSSLSGSPNLTQIYAQVNIAHPITAYFNGLYVAVNKQYSVNYTIITLSICMNSCVAPSHVTHLWKAQIVNPFCTTFPTTKQHTENVGYL